MRSGASLSHSTSFLCACWQVQLQSRSTQDPVMADWPPGCPLSLLSPRRQKGSHCARCVSRQWASKYEPSIPTGLKQRGALDEGPCCCSPTPAPSISVCPVVSGCTTFSQYSSDGHHLSPGLLSWHSCSLFLQWSLWFKMYWSSEDIFHHMQKCFIQQLDYILGSKIVASLPKFDSNVLFCRFRICKKKQTVNIRSDYKMYCIREETLDITLPANETTNL